MNWAAFLYNEITHIAFLKGQHHYPKKLQIQLLLFRKLRAEPCLGVPARSLLHSLVQSAQQWIRQNQENSMDWPVFSPFMNPIDSIWRRKD